MSGLTAGLTPRRTILLGAVVTVMAAVTLLIPFAGKANADVGLVPGTPCAATAQACVLLGDKGFNAKAWLIQDGKVLRGPVPATSGGPGMDTPTGAYRVTSKDADHTSSETRNVRGLPSEMPYAVFYGNSGYAFHGGGDLNTRTAGCIRLADATASYFFNNLAIGDTVQIVPMGTAPAPGESSGKKGGLLGGLTG